ncbi:MAG: uracil-DNA glycosylase family protein, partial [Pseudomonadota bacterium]
MADPAFPPEAPKDCPLCPRLVAFRAENKEAHPDWFNGAVPSFSAAAGDETVKLLVIGLAPGMQGANRTGRPFTGDYAGDLLYATLLEHGFARGTYGRSPEDGLELVETMITNAVRCLPPQNKPTGQEINTCRPYLLSRLEALPHLRTMVALGKIAHDSVVRAL